MVLCHINDNKQQGQFCKQIDFFFVRLKVPSDSGSQHSRSRSTYIDLPVRMCFFCFVGIGWANELSPVWNSIVSGKHHSQHRTAAHVCHQTGEKQFSIVFCIQVTCLFRCQLNSSFLQKIKGTDDMHHTLLTWLEFQTRAENFKLLGHFTCSTVKPDRKMMSSISFALWTASGFTIASVLSTNMCGAVVWGCNSAEISVISNLCCVRCPKSDSCHSNVLTGSKTNGCAHCMRIECSFPERRKDYPMNEKGWLGNKLWTTPLRHVIWLQIRHRQLKA